MEKEEQKNNEGKEVLTKSEESHEHQGLIQCEKLNHNAIQFGLVTFKEEIPKKTLDKVIKDNKRNFLKT